MAAPEYVPSKPTERPRTYSSPDHVPDPWRADRPGDLVGRNPRGMLFGNPGPDQGYGLVLGNRLRERLELTPGEEADDVVRGVVGIGLRRASLFGRAPVIHDMTIAATMWGFLDPSPPDELAALRRKAFEGLSEVGHHYEDLLELVDSAPEATLRMGHRDVQAQYPGRWRELLGLT